MQSRRIKQENKKNIVSIRSTLNLVRYIYDYTAIGLKNPLDFMKKNDKTLKKAILHDRYNGRMHLAVINYIIKNKKDKLLAEIEKENTDKYITGYIKLIQKEGL